MKTKRTLILILLVISVSARAQSIYLRGGLGIAICTAPHMIYQSTTSSGESASTIESKRGGLGTGMPFLVAAGYNLSDNFAVELGVDYFLGFNTKCVNSDGSYSGTIKNSGSMLALVPAFVMKFDLDKFKPYARLGIKVGVWNTAKTKETETGPDENSNRISKDYGGIAIGAQAAAGVEYSLSDLLSLFGEINLDGISYAPTKGKYTKLTNNGVNELNSMTTKEKTWLYVKNLDESQSIPDTDPDKEPKVNYSFANVGLIIGVKINLGK